MSGRGLSEGALVGGRYRIQRWLGEGSAGRVWLVRDTRARGAQWALKELDLSALPLAEAEGAREQFWREARLLGRLRHPSLPRLADRFEEGGRAYLVMERVEGPTLADLLARRGSGFEEARVLGWGAALAEALAYLHGLAPPVIYRDLKPSNVMVPVEGPLKLIDFGIARRLRPDGLGDSEAFGTPGYAPPEQYQGRSLPISDLYALGATLFELLTAREPRTFGFVFPPLRALRPELSPELEALVGACLELDPCRRPQDAGRLAGQLAALAGRPGPGWGALLARRLLQAWRGRRGGGPGGGGK